MQNYYNIKKRNVIDKRRTGIGNSRNRRLKNLPATANFILEDTPFFRYYLFLPLLPDNEISSFCTHYVKSSDDISQFKDSSVLSIYA